MIDSGIYGYPAVAFQNGWSFQLWSWLEADLAIVNSEGCTHTYPLPVSATADYARELACDHVAKIQPPYSNANATRDGSVWAGAVPAEAPRISRSFSFNLQFQDNGYTRVSFPPQNWMSTGLYAAPGEVVTITVSGADTADMGGVYAQLGVTTDVLDPGQANVSGPGVFHRYPNSTIKVKLQPGENLVRTPYGGVIELVSNGSVAKTISVNIANAVETPHFVLGTTTEAEWMAQRIAPGPWAVIESDMAVLFVNSDSLNVIPASGVRALSHAEITGLAQFYRDFIANSYAMMGLAEGNAPPNQLPQGQTRIVRDVQISAGSAHSGYPVMFGRDYPLSSPFHTFQRFDDTDWGLFHEVGHNFQQGPWAGVYGIESTVNYFSVYNQEIFFGTSLLADGVYAEALELLNDASQPDKWNAANAFHKIVFFDQIRLAFPDLDWSILADIYKHYRELSNAEVNAINTDQLRYDVFMRKACDLTSSNLTAHFEAWTVPVSETAKGYCATKPALTRNPWEIDNAKPLWYHPGSGSGSFLREKWNGIDGGSVADLTGNAAYPSRPSLQEVVGAGLEAGQRDDYGYYANSYGDNYGQRLRAFLEPPVTGDYRFWLAGDESAQLLLSTDEDPANSVTIVDLQTNTPGFRAFDAKVMDVQRSGPVTLQAGRRYYIEVLHKESTSLDGVSVAWNIPAVPGKPGEVRKLIDKQFLSPYSGDLSATISLSPGQPSTVLTASDVSYRITVTNRGSFPVRDVTVAQTLPVGFRVSANDTNGWPGTYRYVKFQADSTDVDASAGTATLAEFGLLDGSGNPISKQGWTATADSSQLNWPENSPASFAIDGDISTFWGTKWYPSSDPYPHWLAIDTGSSRTISGFTYVARQNSPNGRVAAYQLFGSNDGTSWTRLDSGSLENVTTIQTKAFGLKNTLPGTIAPGESASVDIVLTASEAAGLFANTAMVATSYDATQSRVFDIDSSNDTASAAVEVVSVIPPSGTPTAPGGQGSPTPTQTPTVAAPASTPTATLAGGSLTPTPTATATPTSLAESHDSVVLPPKPLRITLKKGVSSASKRVKVVVRNADVLPTPESLGHTITLSATSTDCPEGTIADNPDFDPKTAGAQDSVLLGGGRTKVAVVPLAITSSSFSTFNRKAPARCTLTFTVSSVMDGVMVDDPTPGNNSVSVEIEVIDRNDAEGTARHESYVTAMAPVTLKVGRGVASGARQINASVGNADILPSTETPGDLITLAVDDGDCPAGTVAAANFSKPTESPQNSVLVKGGATRRGSFLLTVNAEGFASGNKMSPARCTAVLTATGPSSPDQDPSNNTTKLVIDVIDSNDF